MISSKLQLMQLYYHKGLEKEMGKVLYTDFEGVDDVINSMMDNPQLKKAMTRTNLYNFWDNILPEKLRGKSRPYSMLPGGVMTVTCQNPVIAQELSLKKIILMKKFEPYAKSLKMRITDLRFDSKRWVN
jgi:hypothetical protein